nr:DUF2809 domain-containing protein [Cohnella luojiensis]
MRSRVYYGFAIVITIILGISSREFSSFLPKFVSENFGDGLWASMVYLGFRVLLVRKSLTSALWMSVVFCCGVEFSQLYQADWINEFRSTLPGSLVLGKGFLIADFARYGVGLMTAYLVDRYFQK